jgi:hypothetical protein
MKRLSLWLVAIAVLTLTLGAAFAAEGQEMTEDEMMKAWMETASPDAHHEALAQMAGEWDFTTRSYEAPGEPATVSTGTTVKTMIMGGRYLQEDTQGESFGMPFHGMGLTGYNKTTGKYEWVWFDNMSTALMWGSGTMDGNKLTCYLDYIDPITKMPMKSKTISTIESKDKHVFTWYNLDGDKDTKMMEVEYVRK